MSASVLFVCLGNICRSPTAHGVFAQRVSAAGLSDRIRVDSAGTGDWHVGEPPDPRTQRHARARGYELGSLRARQLHAGDFGRFDFVLAMDRANLAELERACPRDFRGELGLFLAHARAADGVLEVPDPYYGGAQGFETVLDLVEDAAEGLLEHIRRTRL
jgi:protein-tyrosine phosphatase